MSRITQLARLGTLAVASALLWLSPSAAEACSTCFGAAEGPMIDGARMGVWALFGLTFLMQLAFVWFFVTLYRRSRGTAHREAVRENLKVIKG